MSLDRSLKIKGTMASKRSVLKRTERIAKMTLEKKFEPGKTKALGLPKTLVGKG